MSNSDYLRQGLRPNCSRKMGISPLLTVICALRQLSYGIPTDISDNLFDISESTAAQFIHHICVGVKEAFGSLYLREPTMDDIMRIEGDFRNAGFQGCVGCFDCVLDGLGKIAQKHCRE